MNGTAPEPAVLREPEGTTTETGYAGPLFGVTHLPVGTARRGVVVASPLKSELLMNNAREVALGRTLARRGVAVQRFHYRGTGNSLGDPGRLTLQQMIDDTRAAARHLREKTGVEQLTFLGTRLAAHAAAAVAADHPGAAVALWEPAVSGKRYFRDLFRSVMIARLARAEATGTEPGPSPQEVLETEGILDIMGFAVEKSLYDDAAGADLSALGWPDRRRVLLVQMSRADGLRREYGKLTATWEEAGHDVTAIVHPYEEAWWFHQDVDVLDPEAGEALNRRLVDFTARWITEETR